jgi:hypothetical protein
MNKYLTILNYRTALAVAVAAGTTYLTLDHNFQYNFDLTMISIAIVFPLVFTIRSAFRRREKALEFLARFKAGLITVDACFQENRKLAPEKKEEISRIVKILPVHLIDYLTHSNGSPEQLHDEANKVAGFIRSNADEIGNSTALKIYRFMKDVYQGLENVIAIKQHRTPISIRAYCLIFIYIYPIIYTPSLYNRLHEGISYNESWILYTLSIFSTFILISLYNVQDQMENPFDQHGVDDIRLESFRIL